MTAPNRDAERRTQMKLHWEMETGRRQVESGNWNANLLGNGNWKKENGNWNAKWNGTSRPP